MKTKQAVKDWGGILAGVAALAGVGVTYLQTIRTVDVTSEQAAKQEAQLEGAYELLVNAVNRLSNQAGKRDQVIGDLRHAVGKIEGAISHMHSVSEDGPSTSSVRRRSARSRRPASEAPPKLDVGGVEELKPEPPVQVQMRLPPPEPKDVKRKADAMRMKF